MSAWQSQHEQVKEMTPENLEKLKQAQAILAQIMAWARRTFDVVATWVTQLSWWKFCVFAVITLICGNILQESLFSTSDDSHPDVKPRLTRKHSDSGPRSFTDGDTHVTIDNSGIH